MAGRITVINRVHYESTDRKILTAGGSYSRNVSGADQGYSREVTISHEWTALDAGWITGDNPVVLIENYDKSDLQIAVKAGEVMAVWTTLRPSESVRFEPPKVASVFVRAVPGSCAINLTVLPTEK